MHQWLLWALHQMGLVPPNVRLPLTELSAQYHEQMRSALENAGVKLENLA